MEWKPAAAPITGGQEFKKLGHQVAILAAQFVKPYRKGGKNDSNDALAICEAAARPGIWHVPVKSVDQQVLAYDRELAQLVRTDERGKRLMTIPDVGEQVATGIVASVPDPKLFKNSRQFAAWLGLTPRQYTTGGHIRLGRITKRGDKYLGMLLVHGARAVVAKLKDKPDRVSCWIRNLLERRGYLRTVVALAARNARLIWTLLMKQEDYKAMPA